MTVRKNTAVVSIEIIYIIEIYNLYNPSTPYDDALYVESIT